MSEDNITALFRATVAQANAEGKHHAYRDAADRLAVLYDQVEGMPIAQIKTAIDALRAECEVQSYRAHHIAAVCSRRLARAGMELRDDTSAR